MWIPPRLADVGYNTMLEKSSRRNTTVSMFTHWIGYIQICLGLDPPWYGSTLFTQDWLETRTA